jgi:hypothetical protein
MGLKGGDLMGLFGWTRKSERKSFSEPPFWASDAMKGVQFLSPPSGDKERIENDFEGYVNGAFKRNGPIFACMMARQLVFSEARFQYRRFEKGRPTDLFGDKGLALLENPWPAGTTGELLGRMIQDADLAGNAFNTTTDDRARYGHASRGGPGRRVVRMRPDWVTLVLGSKSGSLTALDTRLVGVLYEPKSRTGLGNVADTRDSVLLLPDEVSHFSPIPDPIARHRGMSWLTPIIRDIEADSSATVHKRTFFDHAAVPNMVVKFDKDTAEDAFQEFVEKFKEEHQGAWNAYKTLFLMGGADVTPLTHDFRQMEFTQTVGKGEARIATAAGVPASWVGFSEGLQGSSLNAGNFSAARRRFADGTIRPLWRMAAASLQPLLDDVPAGASLWYDERDIAFLREDSKDRAEILRIELNAVDAGVKAGFDTDAVVEAVRDNDISKLMGRHTGLVSVQMQPPANVDENNTQKAADVLSVQANTVATLLGGRFTEESVIAAVDAGDLSLLEIDEAQPAQLPSVSPAPDEQLPPADKPGGGQ